MIKLLFISIFTLLVSLNGSQNFIISNADYFEIDVQSNLYIVKGAELQKYNSDNELLYTYSNLVYGDISTLDVYKTTNIFLYYRDFNKILFLDNTLSIKYSAIDISELGYPEANLACNSYNNSFWIYDPINMEMLRFGRALQNTDRTGNLYNITNKNINPVQIMEYNNSVYLRDNEYGIFVFDRYGGFLRQIPFTNLEDFYIYNNKWHMLRNDTSFVFNSVNLEVDTIVLPIEGIKQYRFNEETMFYMNNNGELGKLELEIDN